MALILIISKSKQFREELRSGLRKTGARIISHEDIVEGMKELGWFRPDLIFLSVNTANIREVKALSVLRTKYPKIHLMLRLENDIMNEFEKQMADDIVTVDIEVTKIVDKIATTIIELNPA